MLKMQVRNNKSELIYVGPLHNTRTEETNQTSPAPPPTIQMQRIDVKEYEDPHGNGT